MDESRRALALLFHRNGVMRLPNAKRRAKEKRRYKKGYEIRLIALDRKELNEIRRLLRRAGFKVCRPFAKDARFVQPIYGKDAVAEFRRMIEASRAPLS